MFSATRRWLRRNRTPIAVGLGVVGAGYVVTQYVVTKINEARERMSTERIAKENLRRRFEQNQEDCTFTVLALLPTAMTNILETMNTEQITVQIQQIKGAGRVVSAGAGSMSPPSVTETTVTEEDGTSMASLQSGSLIHASQVSIPPALASATEGGGEGGQGAQREHKKTKRQLWDDLTISSITRAFTSLYVLALLSMLTRVQLNLLGRRSYLSSVVTLATGAAQATISLENNDDIGEGQVYGDDFDVNRKYLTFSWWLLNRGWLDVMHKVEAAVRHVFGHLSPRDSLTFDNFSDLTLQVRKIVEGATPEERRKTKWLQFLLPPKDMEDDVIRESGILGDDAMPPSSASTLASLRHLLDETADIIESPAFTHVLTLLLDAGFSALVDKRVASGAYEMPPAESTAIPELARPPSGKAVLLPKILSVLTREAHAIGNGMPNEYLKEMEQVRDLEGFAAVVYSSNWEREMRHDATEDGVGVGTREGGPGRAQPVEESMVVVESQGSFESAWEKATASR